MDILKFLDHIKSWHHFWVHISFRNSKLQHHRQAWWEQQMVQQFKNEKAHSISNLEWKLTIRMLYITQIANNNSWYINSCKILIAWIAWEISLLGACYDHFICVVFHTFFCTFEKANQTNANTLYNFTNKWSPTFFAFRPTLPSHG